MKKLTGVFLACLLAVSANAQVYVSVEGAGLKDGSGWDNAMDNVAGALVKVRAATVKEVWIAGGTYPATDSWGTLNANMKGVTVYGGFKGDETAPTARAKKDGGRAYEFIHPTIIKANVTIAASVGTELPCIIDGFTWAGQTGTFGFRNNTFIRNCTWANLTHGKHVVNAYLTDKADLSDVKSGAIEGCLFLNNTTSGANPLQIGVTATQVGFVVKDCDFIGNVSTHRIVTASANTYVSNCRFINNAAGASAGYPLQVGAGSQVVNCLFANNNAPHAVVFSAGDIQVINTTIANNVGPCAIQWGAGSKAYNTILLGNVNAEGVPVGISGAVASEVKNSAYSVALPDTSAVVTANNLPLSATYVPFTAPSAFVGADATKQTESLAADWSLTVKAHGLINGGKNEFFTGSSDATTDLAGNARIQNKNIDLGAYENASNPPAFPKLTTKAGEGGSIYPLVTNTEYRVGEPITLTATADSGKEFLNWTNAAGTVVSDKIEYTYEMAETAETLTANFQGQSVKYKLEVVAVGNGTATGAGEYFSGTKVELTATPAADHIFVGWKDQNGKIVSRENPYTLTMERKDTLVNANFKYKLTRYLVSPNTVDPENPAPTWTREPIKGETIINLDEVMVNGQKKSIGLDELFADNLFPLPFDAGDEIWLLGGEYQTMATIEIKATAQGIKIYGGFAGTETDIAQRELYDLDNNGVKEPWEMLNASALSGQMQILQASGSVLWMHADDLLVDGVVVEGGRQGSVDFGVGVNLGIRSTTGKGAIMRNSIIRRNLVTGGGTAPAYMCGLAIWDNSVLENSLVENNMIDDSQTATAYAAGLALAKGTVRNCVIRNNRNLATSANGNIHGGGIKMGDGTIENCVINNNYSNQRGGGIYVSPNAGAYVKYCTVVNNKAGGTGAGIYFRSSTAEGATTGTLQNTIVWNNIHEGSEPANTWNIFIQDTKTKGVKIGAVAYNGASNIADNYTPLGGNERSLAELATEGIFNSPLSTVGFNESDDWSGSDWSPKLAGLGIAEQLEEYEFDILGRPRKEGNVGAIGAFEFGSPLSIQQGKVYLDPFVYCTQGQLRVSFYQPVTVEIYDLTGALIQTATAKNDHAFNLTKNAIYTVVVKAGDLSCSKKIAVQ